MVIYGIYRLDHVSLRIKLSQFVTSVMGIVSYSTRFIFKKKENSINLNTENDSYKIFKNIFQRKMLKKKK